MEDLTGRQFGPYRVVAPLGEGGMAAVYKAFQPAVNRYIALKVLPKHFTADPQFLRRFRHEAQIVAKFQHPPILSVFDFGEVDGYTFLAMPFIVGGTLASVMKGQPITLDVAQRVVQQVGDALDYAHSKGIVHRDIKPSNILMDERGNCLVADFGIARMAEGATKLTMTGALIGTPAYMSPEQAMAEPVGPESDLYSLGVVLYEMLTGRVPFQAETPVAVAIKHVTAPLPPPRTFNAALSPDIEAVILKALARSRGDRFNSGAALSRALVAAVRSIQQSGTLIANQSGYAYLVQPQALGRTVETTSRLAGDSPKPSGGGSTVAISAARHAILVTTKWRAVLLAFVFIAGLSLTATYFVRKGWLRRDISGTIGIRWVRIPAGTFMMGCVPGDDECSRADTPRHRVTLSRSFDLMTTEMTLGMFRAFESARGTKVPDCQLDWNDARKPVVCVTWYDAQAFCNFVNGRLPTEAEWEYAARGGQEGTKYVWGNAPRPEVDGKLAANLTDESRKRKSPSADIAFPGFDDKYAETAPVGSFAPNAYGLFDMAGNVWEWVADWYGPYSGDAATDPRGPSGGERRLLRGGGWISPWGLSVSFRDGQRPDFAGVEYGARCARDVSP